MMTFRKVSYLLIVCNIAALLVSCINNRPPLASSFALIMQVQSSIYRVRYNADTQTTTQETILENVNGASLSPDRSKILFGDRPSLSISVFDVQSGNTTHVMDGELQCASWFGDNSKAYFISDHRIYVYNVSGKLTKIFEAPSAEYVIGGVKYGEVLCDQWITSDRFLLQRWTGEFPFEIREGAFFSTNTTTMAILSDPATFIDAPKRWWQLENTCVHGDYLLLEGDEGSYVTRKFQHFADLQPTKVIDDNTFHYIGFVENDIDCKLYVYTFGGSGGDHQISIRTINPVDLSEFQSFAVPIVSEARSVGISPPFSPLYRASNGDFLLAERIRDSDKLAIVIRQASDGNEMRLRLGEFPNYFDIRFMGWVP